MNNDGCVTKRQTTHLLSHGVQVGDVLHLQSGVSWVTVTVTLDTFDLYCDQMTSMISMLVLCCFFYRSIVGPVTIKISYLPVDVLLSASMTISILCLVARRQEPCEKKGVICVCVCA